MLLLAESAVDKMKTLPPDVWLKIGITVAAILIAIFVLRHVLKMNKIIAGIVVMVVCSVVFFSWVYNRNEPKFLTPIVEKIAPFFPSAGSYAAKQGTVPKGTH
jgi:MFS superfamily sulfate permease-like transporter